MKLLVVGDEVSPALERALPGEQFRDVALILSCGDLPYDYLGYLVDALDVPLLYVHGNHDRPAETEHGVIAAPPGGVNIEGRVVEAKGLLIAGLGGSPRYLAHGEHQYTEREMRRRVRRLGPALWWNRVRGGQALDILLTHAPPRGIHDHEDPAHQGFHAFLPFMEHHRPRYLIHGHSYPRPGQPNRTRYRDTEVIHVRGHYLLEVPDA
ncbi:MAG: metallophosphoesterase [Candidatus Acetothermia bacterium]|jgi:predicted phosphodiesterase|nr:metallophosphoesterase [Candidatus Acetothermia bacterium]